MTRSGHIDVTLLREAYLHSELSASEVAKRIGWLHDDGKGYMKGDTSRVQRTLGLKPYDPGNGSPIKYRTEIRYETAELIARAINVDFRDVGL